MTFQDAVFPGWWMNEGGQSATGQVRLIPFTLIFVEFNSPVKLIDFMIKTHPAYSKLELLATEQKTNIHEGKHSRALIGDRTHLDLNGSTSQPTRATAASE